MISRYLVINDDLLCNVFTLQSVWIHYKENRYPLTGITVFNAQNCGIHQSGITVLCFRNDGSESSGILKSDTTLYDPDAARRCMASQDICSGRFLYFLKQ